MENISMTFITEISCEEYYGEDFAAEIDPIDLLTDEELEQLAEENYYQSCIEAGFAPF